MSVCVSVEGLNAAFSEQGVYEPSRRGTSPLEVSFVVEELRGGGATHTQRLAQEQTFLEYLGTLSLALRREVPIALTEQSERTVQRGRPKKAKGRWGVSQLVGNEFANGHAEASVLAAHTDC